MHHPRKALHCTMCGGPHITPATRIRQQSSNIGVTMDFRKEAESWASKGLTSTAVGRARACLDCGHVMLFLTDQNLAELRAGMAAGWQGLPQDFEPV